MIRIRHVVRFAFVIFSLSVAVASAQDTTGTILGTVTDASGAVLPGVTVTVKNIDTSQARTIVSDAAGSVRVPRYCPRDATKSPRSSPASRRWCDRASR